MGSDLHEIVRHHRMYVNERESMDWIPYLCYTARNPRSLRNSWIYEMMTVPCRSTLTGVKTVKGERSFGYLMN